MKEIEPLPCFYPVSDKCPSELYPLVERIAIAKKIDEMIAVINQLQKEIYA